MMKQAFYTALMVVAVTALANQFATTKSLLNGGNKYFG